MWWMKSGKVLLIVVMRRVLPNKIKLLREEPQRTSEKINHARSLVENYYNWDKRAETILHTINKLIS